MLSRYIDGIENCNLIKLYELLGKKWALPILHSFIYDENQRFSQIERKFKNVINPATLAHRLKSFEEYGVLHRNNRVYEITNFGKELMNLLHEIKGQAIEHELNIPEECKKGVCICDKFYKK